MILQSLIVPFMACRMIPLDKDILMYVHAIDIDDVP